MSGHPRIDLNGFAVTLPYGRKVETARERLASERTVAGSGATPFDRSIAERNVADLEAYLPKLEENERAQAAHQEAVDGRRQTAADQLTTRHRDDVKREWLLAHPTATPADFDRNAAAIIAAHDRAVQDAQVAQGAARISVI